MRHAFAQMLLAELTHPDYASLVDPLYAAHKEGKKGFLGFEHSMFSWPTGGC